jgi:hypothetical protein
VFGWHGILVSTFSLLQRRSVNRDFYSGEVRGGTHFAAFRNLRKKKESNAQMRHTLLWPGSPTVTSSGLAVEVLIGGVKETKMKVV